MVGVNPHNVKTDADREKSERFEYVIRFSVASEQFFLSIFADFLLIFGIIGESGLCRFSSNDCQSCQLTPSNRICSYKFFKMSRTPLIFVENVKKLLFSRQF